MVSNVAEKVELRGRVVRVSDNNELVRGGRVRGGYYFLWVKYNRINNEKKTGTAKVYVSTEALGLGRSDGIFFYPTNDLNHPEKEFRTAIVNPHRLIDEYIGLRGYMKKASPKDNADIFVSRLEKVKIFPDPKTYVKR